MIIYDNVAVEQVLMVGELVWMQQQAQFFKEEIEIQDRSLVEKKLQKLVDEDIHSVEELEQWLLRETELFEKIEEVVSGYYIAFNRYNNNEEYRKKHEYIQRVIMPLLKKYSFKLNRKFYDSPYREQLDQEQYKQLIRSKVNSIELFREENIPLEVKEDQLHNEYFRITGSITVEWEGEEKTIPQMRRHMIVPDREVRKKAWNKVWSKLSEHEERLNAIMTELIQIRHQKALHAGFENYRDYMFKAYERFDYTPEDCYRFHDAVEKVIVPLVTGIQKQHKEKLGVDRYRPWDMYAIPKGEKPLRPFQSAEELVKGTIEIFHQLDPQFAQLIRDMRDHDLLDLESRKAKSPGGFCSDLPITELSFIFMNAIGTPHDLSTMVHEGGHCVHNLLVQKQNLANYKSTPMESAELASMSMELFTMDKWDCFYQDDEDLKRAQKEHVEGIISMFPWTMVIDRFQHWMYENPNHTVQEREEKFMEIADKFVHAYMDVEGVEDKVKLRWLMQLHIFEVPFYYIEYAIAQLGALQMWKSYHENPDQTIKNYKQALSLGSSRSLPEVYEAAGISFDFSEDIIKELMDFTQKRISQFKS